MFDTGGNGPGPTLLVAAMLTAGGLWLGPRLQEAVWPQVREAGSPLPWPAEPLHTAPASGTRPAATALGGAASGVAGAALLFLLLLAGGLRPGTGAPGGFGPGTAADVVLACAVAVAEEGLMRGAAFAAIAERTGLAEAVWGTAALTAVAGWLSGMGPAAGLTTLLLGLWWGQGRARTGGTLWSTCSHAAWNVALGPLLGLGGEVAAGTGRALLLPHAGPAAWAGPPGAVEGGLAAAAAGAVLAAVPAALGVLGGSRGGRPGAKT